MTLHVSQEELVELHEASCWSTAGDWSTGVSFAGVIRAACGVVCINSRRSVNRCLVRRSYQSCMRRMRALWWSQGGVLFLMGEVPLCDPPVAVERMWHI